MYGTSSRCRCLVRADQELYIHVLGKRSWIYRRQPHCIADSRYGTCSEETQACWKGWDTGLKYLQLLWYSFGLKGVHKPAWCWNYRAAQSLDWVFTQNLFFLVVFFLWGIAVKNRAYIVLYKCDTLAWICARLIAWFDVSCIEIIMLWLLLFLDLQSIYCCFLKYVMSPTCFVSGRYFFAYMSWLAIL